jgi:3-keto-5-aminohexanoate cleavage enzyme
MTDRLLVTVAPSIPPYMARSVPGVDLSPEGIAAEVVRAYNAGACIAHLHVWDEHGQPTTDLTAFRRTLDLIRQRCDIIIEGSTGGINTLSPQQRSVSLNAGVEMASLNPGSVNYDGGVYVNSPDDIHYWASEMDSRSIKPSVAIFEAGMIANTQRLIEQGFFQPPYAFGFVLGQAGALPATPKNLLYLSELLPPDSVWTAIGHSGHDVQMGALAMNMGGHVRAGFEDNPYYRPGEVAASNAQLIERLVRLAREVGREIATAQEARQMLRLNGR